MQTFNHQLITLAPPRVITVTITEEDRQKAAGFCDNGHCILSTALRRMGYDSIMVGVKSAHLRNVSYEVSHNGKPGWGAESSCCTEDWGHAGDGPYYRPGVVGKTIVLTREAQP